MPIDKRVYDYVVVGAGTTGCLIASALAARGARVAVLDAGTKPLHLDREKLCDWLKLLNTSIDHKYHTASRALPGSVTWNQGRVLGGSGVMNGMIYIRGCKADYENWASLSGDCGWNEACVAALYSRLEHRASGPAPACKIAVQLPQPITPWSDAFHEACRIAGFLEGAADPWIRRGVCRYLISASADKRASTYGSHLLASLELANLEIIEATEIERVVFEGTRAVAVETRAGDTIAADSEIILCCGGIETPRLLLRSGVGPRQALGHAGIPCLVHNPHVGAHIMDHPRVVLRVPAKRGYRLSQNSTGTEAGLFFDVDDLDEEAMPPQIQCMIKPPLESSEPACAIGVLLTHPRSSGTIALDPKSQSGLAIDNGYFDVATDLTLFASALGRVRALLADSREALELSADWETQFPDDLENLVRERVQTTWHYSCGARMARSDESGVVDSDFRVFGTERLRVCDTSAFPDMPTANINAPAMMFALHAAERIAI